MAQQEGITGTLLQNQFVADILSSVEFIAHSNKKRIEGKAGFFGLIVCGSRLWPVVVWLAQC